MLQLTERAAKEVQKIVSEQGMPADTMLRVGVTGGGCSGFSYNLQFDTQTQDGDQVTEISGVKVVVDSKSFLYLDGTQVDFQDGLNGRGFTFSNPNASSTCGCGTSFGV